MEKMSLQSISISRSDLPDRILLVGTEGVGKSTWAASAPSPVFVAAEDGLRHLEVPHFPEPSTFTDVLEAVAVLIREDHTYRTLVLDTLDWIEPLVWAEVCAENGWPNIEAPGYGRGYTLALDKWRRLQSGLEMLRRKRNIEVILLAHAAIKTFANPAGQDYARYELKLHRGAASLWREWTDTNLFAMYEESIGRDRGEVRVKARSTGARVVKTVRTAAWDAKNRYSLPDELPLNYGDYAAARAAGAPAPAATLLDECRTLIEQLKPEGELATKIAATISANTTNPRQLAIVANRLRALVAEKEAA